MSSPYFAMYGPPPNPPPTASLPELPSPFQHQGSEKYVQHRSFPQPNSTNSSFSYPSPSDSCGSTYAPTGRYYISPGGASFASSCDSDPRSPVTPLSNIPPRPNPLTKPRLSYGKVPLDLRFADVAVAGEISPTSIVPPLAEFHLYGQTPVYQQSIPSQYSPVHSIPPSLDIFASTTLVNQAVQVQQNGDFDAGMIRGQGPEVYGAPDASHRSSDNDLGEYSGYFNIAWSSENVEMIPHVENAGQIFSPSYSFPPRAPSTVVGTASVSPSQGLPVDVEVDLSVDGWSQIGHGINATGGANAHPVLASPFSPTFVNHPQPAGPSTSSLHPYTLEFLLGSHQQSPDSLSIHPTTPSPSLRDKPYVHPSPQPRSVAPPKFRSKRPFARKSLAQHLQANLKSRLAGTNQESGKGKGKVNAGDPLVTSGLYPPLHFSPMKEGQAIMATIDTQSTPEDLPTPEFSPPTLSRMYSVDFPQGHHLCKSFVKRYHLQAQIGSGGFGFVMTALSRMTGKEVAVKFINKKKIPREHVIEDPALGGLVPLEAMILRITNFKGIVRFLDFFQDDAFYYLVQELHGSPWHKSSAEAHAVPTVLTPPSLPTPSNSASFTSLVTMSGDSLLPASELDKPTSCVPLDDEIFPLTPDTSPATSQPSNNSSSYFSLAAKAPFPDDTLVSAPSRPLEVFPSSLPDWAKGSDSCHETVDEPMPDSFHSFRFPPILTVDGPDHEAQKDVQGQEKLKGNTFGPAPLLTPPEFPQRPNMARRPSHDLFECIEQHKTLSEPQARYIFAQVVETVEYLDSLGISHRDIKDENLVVDKDFNVKLIDFGSAVIRDLNEPEPYYTKFYGTVTFASSEILQNNPYRARPAEIWTLGVLLTFLVSGESPFPDTDYAVLGSPVFSERRKDGSPIALSEECKDLIRGCLRCNPGERFTISEVKNHPWLYKDFNS
ncbi:hypothetical protein FRB99_000201 [Tulasnella sp. 403]|nr:hypothetical protein FRB99_000201 [Tulasnella sp. 403]